MGKPPTSQGERILALLTDPRLWRAGVAAAELAQELSVTVRQLRRDRALLERYGFATCVEVGEDGVHRVCFFRDGMSKRSPGLRGALESAISGSSKSAGRESSTRR